MYFGSASRCDSLAWVSFWHSLQIVCPSSTSAVRFLLVSGGLTGWIASSAWVTDQPGRASVQMVLGRLIISLASGAILYGCLYSRNKLVTGELGGAAG